MGLRGGGGGEWEMADITGQWRGWRGARGNGSCARIADSATIVRRRSGREDNRKVFITDGGKG
jgi:hypothetical protein